MSEGYQSKICPQCGRQMHEDGICMECGKHPRMFDSEGVAYSDEELYKINEEALENARKKRNRN